MLFLPQTLLSSDYILRTQVWPRNGKVYKAEFELRHNLGIISESLSSISINSNITLTHSLIELSNIEYNSRLENARTGQTIDKYRDMAGQAPYIVNAGISFNGRDDSFLNRIETGLFYNVQGLTLEYVGVADRPDIYIKSYHSLNFNSGIKFGSDKNLSLNFKVQNILDQKNELIYRSFKANDQIFKSRKPGRNFSVSLSFSFL